MTTRYDRMRAAARWIDDSCGEPSDIGNELRADADEFERVEREMRSDNPSYTVWAISNGQADDWADRIRGGQMSNNVPLLTAEMAALLRGHDPAHIAGCVEALEAIATGRAVVVPRMTEAEVREKFSKWADPNIGRVENRIEWRAYLAALRDLGLIRD